MEEVEPESFGDLDGAPATPTKDLYAVLGVGKDATLEAIKRSYKRLALKFHPDKNNGDEEAELRFKLVAQAHEILSEPEKRRYYDETGDIEDVHLSAEDFMAMFRETMVELMAGVSVREMLEGMTDEEVETMPPFPFPRELFPPGTFPEGLRCSSEGLKGVPPSVSAILKSDRPERLGEMYEAAESRAPGSEDDEDEAKQRRRRNKFFGGSPFNPFGGGAGDLGDLGDLAGLDEGDLLGLGLDDMEAMEALFSRGPPPPLSRGGGGRAGTQRRKGKRGKQKQRRAKGGSPSGGFSMRDLEQASDDLLFQILGGQMKDIPDDIEGMERLMQQAMGLEDFAGEGPSAVEELSMEEGLPEEEQGGSRPEASSGRVAEPNSKVGKEWIAAAKAGDASTLAKLLGKHPDLVNFCGPGVGHSALHWLCAKNYKGLVVWIVGQGADVNKRNSEGSTPLHTAATNGNMECVQMLLHYGADPRARDCYGETAAKAAKDRKNADIHRVLERAAGGGAPSTVERVEEVSANQPSSDHGVAEAVRPEEEHSEAAADAISVTSTEVTEEEEGGITGETSGTGRIDPGSPNASSSEVVARFDDGGRIGKEKGRAWMKAAKDGDLDVLKSLLGEGLHYLVYMGSGTNYSFTGNTAVHWCAAKGHVEALRWLLVQGGDPNAPNNAGSTPVHSAGVNGQVETAKVLVFEFGGDASIADGLGDLPRDAVTARAKEGAEAMARLLDLSVQARRLREAGRENWSARDMRVALSLAKKESNFAEKSDLQNAVVELLAELPQPRRPERSAQDVRRECGGAMADPALSSRAVDPKPAREVGAGAKGGAEGGDLSVLSAKAKAKGNDAFREGDFKRATHHYSMAIRLDPGNHVNYSNRSASHASLGRWQDALDDGERCIRMAPLWGKGFARKAAALLGMGQSGEALKVYKAGLKAEPGNQACKSGIAEAKESILRHRQRYEEMWGK